MRLAIPALVATTMALSLSAQSTGMFAGKVLDSKGQPVPNSKVTVSKVGLNWVKEIKINSDGKFLQVGLEPKIYTITVSAPGYLDIKEQEKIELGTTLTKDYVLLTTAEAIKAGKVALPADPGAAAEVKGLESFNQAVLAFNEKSYSTALPLFETAVSSLKESIEKTTDAVAKTEASEKLETVERPYAYTLMEVAKTDEARRAELTAKAEPLLAKVFERNPKDQNALVYLIEVAKTKHDQEGLKKYQAAYDALVGPRPETAYNQGVELYNANKLSEAKPFLQKSIAIKADFAEAYYLLAMCEFAEMNLKGTKTNLQKYLELAPTGKHAAEVREMLKAPELKNAK